METLLIILWWVFGTANLLLLVKVTGDTRVSDLIICITLGCVGPIGLIYWAFFLDEDGSFWNKKLW